MTDDAGAMPGNNARMVTKKPRCQPPPRLIYHALRQVVAGHLIHRHGISRQSYKKAEIRFRQRLKPKISASEIEREREKEKERKRERERERERNRERQTDTQTERDRLTDVEIERTEIQRDRMTDEQKL